jgi:hypothetical protein
MRTERERREYVISQYFSAAVRVGLGVALLIAALQAYRAAQIHAPGVSLALRLFIPFAFGAGGFLALRTGVRGFREARELLHTPLLDPTEDDD